jgi:hypothetical protein
MDEDQVLWEAVRDRLVQVMATSGLSDVGLTLATINALMEVLTTGGLSLEEAKAQVAKTLKPFGMWKTQGENE